MTTNSLGIIIRDKNRVNTRFLPLKLRRENAKAAGAEMIITACPLCQYNLKKSGSDIPVVYFTEILAQALGIKEDANE